MRENSIGNAVGGSDFEDDECDVLVVGSGAGGMLAAYTAAREGASVVLVEATDRFGGTTAYSGAGMWFPCNAVLRRSGDDDTIEEALEYYRAVVGDRTPAALQEAFVTHGAHVIDYLEQDSAFEFDVWPWPDYYGDAPSARATGRHIVPRPLPDGELGGLGNLLRQTLGVDRLGQPRPEQVAGGRALIGRFMLALDRFPNVTAHLETAFEDFVVEDGRVVGAVVRHAGVPRTVRARRGVVVAAGGFEQNAQMREFFGVPGAVAGSTGCEGNTGAPIRAGLKIGASLDLMSEAWWAPGLVHPDGHTTFALWFTGGIFVDGDGERFTNESAPYDTIGRDVIDAMAAGRVGDVFWMIHDDRDGEVPPVKAPNQPFVDSDLYRQAGLWHSAGTIAELAELIGVPADKLESTVARFNAFAAAEVDEDFRRGDQPYDRSFSEGRSPMVPVTEAPFHAAAFGLSDLGTKGGLRTDENARVLDTQGRPIQGLYAVGNSMAAASGKAYPAGGHPIGSSMVFAHLAVLDALGINPVPQEIAPQEIALSGGERR